MPRGKKEKENDNTVPLNVFKKRGRKPKPKIEKPKKVKKEKPLKLYFGIPPVPKGHRQASMKEALDAKKINYYGLKTVDSKLLNSNNKEDENEGSLMLNLSKLMGNLTRLKREIQAIPNQTAEKLAKITEYNEGRQQLIKLNEKYQRIKARKTKVGTGKTLGANYVDKLVIDSTDEEDVMPYVRTDKIDKQMNKMKLVIDDYEDLTLPELSKFSMKDLRIMMAGFSGKLGGLKKEIEGLGQKDPERKEKEDEFENIRKRLIYLNNKIKSLPEEKNNLDDEPEDEEIQFPKIEKEKDNSDSEEEETRFNPEFYNLPKLKGVSINNDLERLISAKNEEIEAINKIIDKELKNIFDGDGDEYVINELRDKIDEKYNELSVLTKMRAEQGKNEPMPIVPESRYKPMKPMGQSSNPRTKIRLVPQAPEKKEEEEEEVKTVFSPRRGRHLKIN